MKPFDAHGTFWPEPGTDGLRRLAVRGAGVTVFSSGFSLALQVIATVTLARLLTPWDFGVVTMVTTFSLLLVNFGLNGFTEAVLQCEEMDRALASNLFWISSGIGSLLTIAFSAGGSWLARFYHEPLVARVAVGISLTIVITSVSVMHLALLKRAMLFSAISANDIVARVASLVASIALAWAGWGYWALVAGAIMLSLSTTIGAFLLCRWIPGLPRRVPGTTSMMAFAAHVYARFSVNYFSRNMDNLLVGWRFNALALGFYKKAYDLFALSASQLVSPLTVVAVAALSRLKKDSVQYRRYFLNALAVIAFVGMGLGADLTLVGKDLIRLLLGPGWEPAGRIFTFFGPGIGIMILYGTHGWIHLSIGRADRWFRWGILEFAFTALCFLLALRWGPVGIALAWTGSFWILTIPAFWYAGKPIRFGVIPVFAVIWKYLLASGLAGCTCALIMWELPSFRTAPVGLQALTRIVMVSLLFTALYVGAVVILHRGWSPLLLVASLLREMGPRTGLSPSTVAPRGGTGTRDALTLLGGK